MVSSRPLNLLCLCTLPPHPGGSAISSSQLLVSLCELGQRVRAVAPITREALQSGDAFACTHPQLGVTRYLVPYFDTMPYVPYDSRLDPDYRRLERQQLQRILPGLIAGEPADLIICGRETFVWHGPEIAKAHACPCVLLLRGSPTWQILEGTYPPDLTKQWLEQYRKVDFLVTVAEYMAEGLRQLGFRNIRSIDNAIDLDRFAPRPKSRSLLGELGILEEDIVVMHVANLHRRKRSVDLVESAERALRENSSLRYVIVGDGSWRPRLEDGCRRKRISDRFRFVGWIDYECVPEYINLADMVVLPSEGEGLARVYLETQASGRLLIASDIPAAREVINDGETGLLFRKGDVEELTSRILLAASDPALRTRIGGNARQRATAHSIQRAAADYLTLFQTIIRERSRSSRH